MPLKIWDNQLDRASPDDISLTWCYRYKQQRVQGDGILKREGRGRHVDEIFVTGITGSFHFDKFINGATIYTKYALHAEYGSGQVTKVGLSCYLVLLSNDSKTR